MRPPERRGRAATHAGPAIFSTGQRRAAVTYAVVVGLVLVAASSAVGPGRDAYLTAWVAAAGPYTTPALALSWFLAFRAHTAHRRFWLQWAIGLSVAYAAGACLLAGVFFERQGLVAAATGLVIVALVIWAWAALLMLRSKSGRRRLSVDLLDSTIAVVVLSAPGVYFFLSPLLQTSEVWIAVPFALFVAAAPAAIYLAFANFSRLPPGQRDTQTIAVVLSGVSALNIALQVAQFLEDFTLWVPPLIAIQAFNMALLLAMPLWARRASPAGLDRLAPEHQVRTRNPMPYIGALVLPVLAFLAWRDRDDVSWGPAFVIGVLLVLALLNAIRYTLMTSETRRLYGELSRVAEERRALLADLVRALEDDRHRMAAELHEQAVESFATLGTLVQTAYVTLPPDTALTVKESIAAIQHDLAERVESFRRLMVAIQPPALEEGGLATAVRAYASELFGDRSGTLVDISVDPGLVLDWSTKTIVYRIAQDALDNVAAHAAAPTVTVSVREDAGAVMVTIEDDGIGFDPGGVAEGGGFAAMRLFAGLGRGTFAVASGPGRVTRVTVCLGVLDESTTPPEGDGARPVGRPVLRAVPDA